MTSRRTRRLPQSGAAGRHDLLLPTPHPHARRPVDTLLAPRRGTAQSRAPGVRGDGGHNAQRGACQSAGRRGATPAYLGVDNNGIDVPGVVPLGMIDVAPDDAPEPWSIALLGVGVLGIGLGRWRWE